VAFSIFAAADAYVNGQYIGSHEETSWTVMSNGEQLICAEGVFESTGKVTTEATIKRIVAKDGPLETEADLTELVINQADITFALQTNGKSYQVKGRLNRDQINSNVKTGTVRSDASFRGGPPTEIPIVF
jgi:hypothetical protein